MRINLLLLSVFFVHVSYGVVYQIGYFDSNSPLLEKSVNEIYGSYRELCNSYSKDVVSSATRILLRVGTLKKDERLVVLKNGESVLDFFVFKIEGSKLFLRALTVVEKKEGWDLLHFILKENADIKSIDLHCPSDIDPFVASLRETYKETVIDNNSSTFSVGTL